MDLGGLELSRPTQVGSWLLAAWALSERVAQMRGLSQPTSLQREKKTLALLQTTFFGVVLYALTDAAVLQRTVMPRSWYAWRWFGASLVVAGILLRALARRTLGRNFSGYVQTSPGHRLVTDGVYRWVRHPLYLGYVGLLIGWPLCFGSLGALAAAVVLGLPALAVRLQIEEQALAEWFGPQYAAYQRRTKRMIPGIW